MENKYSELDIRKLEEEVKEFLEKKRIFLISSLIFFAIAVALTIFGFLFLAVMPDKFEFALMFFSIGTALGVMGVALVIIRHALYDMRIKNRRLILRGYRYQSFGSDNQENR